MTDSRWLFITLLGPEGPGFWGEDPARAALQDALLPTLAQVCGPRRWFFRRLGLREEVGDAIHHRTFSIYVELAAAEAPEAFVRLIAQQLPPGWSLLTHRDWEVDFGPEYGGPAGQQAMLDLCCALTRSLATNQDPPLNGVIHWMRWLFGVTSGGAIAQALGLGIEERGR